MKVFPAILLASLPLATFAAPAPAHRPFQDEDKEEVVDKRPEVKDLLKELSSQIKKKGDEDDEAIGTIDALLKEFGQSGPKDREAIVKGVEGCFKVKRKELEDDVPDDRLYMASALALQNMAPESVKPLIKLTSNKTVEDNMGLHAQVIRSLGKTKSEDAVEPLLDFLKYKDPEIQAAAAEGLGNYSELDQDKRKEVFNDLLKLMMGAKSRVDADSTDAIARERWDIISGPIITTLQLLTGQGESNPENWQHWWNKNKKENWDDLG